MTGSGEELRKKKFYLEGRADFRRGRLLTDNPHYKKSDRDAWDWAFGWNDALALKVREMEASGR